MRAGILTLPFNVNYGGVLQNYALQQALRKLGHEPVTIFRVPYDEPENRSAKGRLRRLASWAKRSFQYHVLRRNVMRFYNITGKPSAHSYGCENTHQFIRENIAISKPVLSTEKMAKLCDSGEFDVLVVGSDQIWRQAYNRCVTDYFLCFETARPVRAIAYAASFGINGHDLDKATLEKCRIGIGKFSALSVRETSAATTLAEEFGREDAAVVVDPTMLLDGEEYMSVIPADMLNRQSGLVTYFLDETDVKKQIANNAATVYSESLRTDIGFGDNVKGDRRCTVEQWLATIANATAVVTDSFHGCVFSILFEKPFIAIVNSERGTDRFYSLLEPLGLTDRIVSSADDIPQKGIDYAKVRDRLEGLRRPSLEFLGKALS